MIFPDGIDYFTAAPLNEEEKRYDLLIKRFEAHLPADDGMRAKAVPVIQAGIAEFKTASPLHWIKRVTKPPWPPASSMP